MERALIAFQCRDFLGERGLSNVRSIDSDAMTQAGYPDATFSNLSDSGANSDALMSEEPTADRDPLLLDDPFNGVFNAW